MISRARLCMPALGAQLPHPGVDDRHPGAPLGPGRQRVRRRTASCSVAPAPVGRRGDLREGGGDLVVEVPPAELPDERARPGRRPRFGHRQRRHAAEAQVRAEPGGVVAGQVVVDVVVPGQGRAASPRSRRRATPSRRRRPRPATRRPAASGSRPAWTPSGSRDPRCGAASSSRQLYAAQAAVVRGEDPVVVAAAAGRSAPGSTTVDAGEEPQVQPVPLALGAQPPLPAAGVPADVGGERRPPRRRPRRASRIVSATGSPCRTTRSPPRPRSASRRSARPWCRKRVRLAERSGQRRVEHVQRHHPVERRAGGGERRVVVHPQVAGEQHDRRAPVIRPPWRRAGDDDRACRSG